jgi:hypothetical protein
MSKYFRSGQFELAKLTVITTGEAPVELDMSNAYVNVTLYESIFNKCMSGTISFVDTNNIINMYGLGNGETVEIQFNTSGVTEPIKFTGTVFELMGPAVLNDHASGYTLHFASPISLNSMRLALFNPYKDTVDKSVADIYGKLSGKKKLDTHKTKYLEHVVLTGQRPLEAIDMFSQMAVGSDASYGYMFFEDNTQFNFKPLSVLYKQEPVREFFYSSMPAFDNVKNSHEEMFDVYQEFEYEEGSKYIELIDDGILGTTVNSVSLSEKSNTVTSYLPEKVFSKSSALADHTFLTKHKTSNQSRVRVTYDIKSRQSELDVEKNRLHKFKALSTVLNIGIFGDSTLRVGQTCIANVPTYSTEDFSHNAINPYSGKFLIAEIKHVFSPKQYNQRIMLIKDSYEEKLA